VKPDRRSPGAHESGAQIDVSRAPATLIFKTSSAAASVTRRPPTIFGALPSLGLQFGDLRPASVHDDDGVPRAPQLDDVLASGSNSAERAISPPTFNDQARV